jgi:hypothetical protein
MTVAPPEADASLMQPQPLGAVADQASLLSEFQVGVTPEPTLRDMRPQAQPRIMSPLVADTPSYSEHFSPRDMLGHRAYAEHEKDPHYASREALDQILDMNKRLLQSQNEFNQNSYGMHHALAMDNANVEQRMQQLYRQFQHARHSLTDTNL